MTVRPAADRVGAALARRCGLPQDEPVWSLLAADRLRNRRYRRSWEAALRAARGLGRWLPYHDLTLLGQLDFERMLDLFYYHLGHYLLSPARPADRSDEERRAARELARIRGELAVRMLPFRQMPCTPATAIERARRVLELAPRGRILLLGDDDLTSVALAMLGGAGLELTVVDIDRRLLDAIARAVEPLGASPVLIERDLFARADPPGSGFDLVLADPSYDEPWIRRFGEIAAVALRPGGRYLLSFPGPQGGRWFPRWIDQADRAGLELLDRQTAFNEYPLPPLRGLWLRLATGLLLRSVEPAVRQAYSNLQFIYSDLWEYRRR